MKLNTYDFLFFTWSRVVNCPGLKLSGWCLAGLDSPGEDGVADSDSWTEDVQGRNPGTGDYHRLIS